MHTRKFGSGSKAGAILQELRIAGVTGERLCAMRTKSFWKGGTFAPGGPFNEGPVRHESPTTAALAHGDPFHPDTRYRQVRSLQRSEPGPANMRSLRGGRRQGVTRQPRTWEPVNSELGVWRLAQGLGFTSMDASIAPTGGG
jgi:hypothetical protein